MSRRPELHRLSKPFPPKFVADKQGASYVNHGVVRQRILGTVGPFDVRIVDVIRGDFDERNTGSGNTKRTWPARHDAVVGVVVECTFHIDGENVVVQDVGTPEGYYMADHDGDRLKKAVSDGIKRCAMNVGVALNLWSKGSWFLTAMLDKDLDEDVESDAPEPDHDAPDPDEASEPSAPASFEQQVSESSVDEVKALVEDGIWEAADVLEVEAAHRDRSTLTGWLEDRVNTEAGPEAGSNGEVSEADWKAIADEAGVPMGRLLIRARQFAEQAGVQAPTDVESIPAELDGPLLEWLEGASS